EIRKALLFLRILSERSRWRQRLLRLCLRRQCLLPTKRLSRTGELLHENHQFLFQVRKVLSALDLFYRGVAMSFQGTSIIYTELDEVSVSNSEEFDDSLTHLWCECKGDTVGLCGVDL